MLNDFYVIVIPECFYSQQAIELLTSQQAIFRKIELTNKKEQEQAKLQYKHPTFPIVLEREQEGLRLVGGYDELSQLWKKKEIQTK